MTLPPWRSVVVSVCIVAMSIAAGAITIRKPIKRIHSPKDQSPTLFRNKTFGIIIPPGPPGDKNPPTNSLTVEWDYDTNSGCSFECHYGPYSGGETGLLTTTNLSCVVSGLVRRPWYFYVLAISNSIPSDPSIEIRWPWCNIVVRAEGSNLRYAPSLESKWESVSSPWQYTNPPPTGFFKNATSITNWVQP